MEQSRQRIVPSGKVYRQKFDAEVQLVKALENQGDSKHGERLPALAGQPCPETSGIPLVRAQRQTDRNGMLDERQRAWADSLPNEASVENPVLYKCYSDDLKRRIKEPESKLASAEVMGLPDVLTPAKQGSNIIDRIAESRKARHEAAVEDMHQELGVISSETEALVEEAGQIIMQKLQENDEVLNTVLAKIDVDEKLLCYSLSELEELWSEAASHSVQRQMWIKELDGRLAEIEQMRMNKIRETFHTYSRMLEDIAHLMSPDLNRLLDQESQSLNQTVLSNKRACADLYSRLMMADIEREKRLHIYWKDKVEGWRNLKAQATVDNFKAKMESTSVENPVGPQNTEDQWTKEQAKLNNKRIELVNSLRDMKPPSSTTSFVFHWNETITTLSKQLAELNHKFFNISCVEFEKVCQESLSEVEEIRKNMVCEGMCSEEVAVEIVTEQCLPVVGERQTHYETMLELMDKSLEQHNAEVLQILTDLFKFIQAAAQVWDSHESGLAQQERSLLNKLEECRRKHDSENQDKEANLDIVMDHLRQDASEESLKENLKKALQMLEKIKEGYTVFKQQQEDIVALYPGMVKEEVQSYQEAVCQLFGLRGDFELAKERTMPTKDINAANEEGKKKKKKKDKPPVSRSSSRSSTSSPKIDEGHLQTEDKETLFTKRGTRYYVLPEHSTLTEPENPKKSTSKHPVSSEQQAEAQPEASPTDLRTAGGALPPYLREMNVSPEVVAEVKKQILMNFLDHLDEWVEQSAERARSVVVAKREELNNELDLRLHLHEPRASRAEDDIHNVRAAELTMHNDRVTQHTKGINQTLMDLKSQFSDLTEEHDSLAIKFKEDIEALEKVFENAAKSSKLVALSNQVQAEQEKFMNVIRTELREFRQKLDDTLQMLRETSANFILAFKLFSEGGNFSPEEVDDYKKRLEKAAQKIDSTEGAIMADLEGMESKKLEQSTKICSDFEDRFKHHMVDLVFVEKVARWLTNIQVKIKSEVADSNSQTEKIARYLSDLEQKLDACEHPSPDKQTVLPKDLLDTLQEMFEVFQSRSLYLNCLRGHAPRRTHSGALQGAPASSMKGVSQSNKPGVAPVPDAQTAATGKGAAKPQTENPTVNVIRNILQAQKKNDTDHMEQQPASTKTGQTQKDKQSAKRRGSAAQHAEGRRSKSKSPIKAANTNSNQGAGADPKGITAGIKLFGDYIELVVIQSNLRRSSKGKQVEKKFMLLDGQKDEAKEEDTHFLLKIQCLLKEALDGLLTTAEIFYRQKGNRPVTRLQALQETFDAFAEVLAQKLQSYYTQADDYHNQCLLEFRKQLVRFEELAARVPACVVKELVFKSNEQVFTKRKTLNEECSRNLSTLELEKHQHQSELRPSLGHPDKLSEVRELCEKEDARKQQYQHFVDEHSEAARKVLMETCKVFVESLAKDCEEMLLLFDNLLVVDDVVKGRTPPRKYPTSELIRRQNAGLPLEDEEEESKQTRGKNTWPGLPRDELFPVKTDEETPKLKAKDKSTASKKADKSAKEPNTASVRTTKTTLAHTATVKARDVAYQTYKKTVESTVAEIEDERQKRVTTEQRWTESWTASVQKVKDLY